MVSISTVKTETGKVTCETSGGTMINININQRSALDCLLDTIQTFRPMKKSGMDTKPSSGSSPGLRLGLAASMMSMGGVCLTLAVIVCVVQPQWILFYVRTLYWVGIPFIISGVLNIVTCRSTKIFWEILAFISLLLSFSVSIAGLVFAINDYSNNYYWRSNFFNLCENLQNGGSSFYYAYRTTRPPMNDYESNWNLSQCKQGFQQYMTLLSGLLIMIILLMVWGLCLSILTLGCRLKAFCCGLKCMKPAEEQDDALLPANPPGEIFIA